MKTPLRWLVATLAVAGIGCHEVHFEAHSAEGEIDLYDDLYAVSVPTDSRAVAVGYMGAIYTTNDGGNAWRKVASGTQRLLYGISMADAERGWAVGQLGTILKTKDGGATWEAQANSKADDGFHLFAVHAIDANTAWAVGEWGARLMTEDGGISWQDHSLTISMEHPQYVWLNPPEQDRVRRGEKVFEDVGLVDIYCRPAPSQRCWLIGEFGYIFWSDDRGRNWNRSEIVGTEKIAPVYFPYDGADVTDEDTARITAFVEAVIAREHLNIQIEPFANARELREYGRGDDPSTLFDILDARMISIRGIVEETGILSDRLRMRGTPPWDYEDFIEDDPEFLTRYLDGRVADRPMVRVSIAQNPFLFRIRFSDEENGVITGLGGVAMVSEDGGLTWRYSETGTKQALFAVSLEAGSALAVGEKGLIRVSGDGGWNWGPPPSGAFPEIFTFMRDMGFDAERKVGMIVGQRGKVLRSRDDGTTWQEVLPPKKTASVDEH